MGYAVNIRAALSSRLAELAPALPTEWEGVAFKAPKDDPWQQAFVRLAPPFNGENGPRAIVSGFFQVTLCYPFGFGTNAAESRADALVEHFARATSFADASGQVVTVSATPEIWPGAREGGLWVLRVRIPFFAHVN